MSEACCGIQSTAPRHLLIIGGGSAAFAAALRASELGARATIINSGLPIGGTCVNVGCVPSKTLIRAAEAHHRASHHHFAGIRGTSRVEDFAAIIAAKRALVAELREAKYVDVVKAREGVHVIAGRARLRSATSVEVDGRELRGDRVLVATGAAPALPTIAGLADVPYLTNESAFELDVLPASLLVLGGRYIALETAQMFARLGSRVTVLQRSARILPTESPEITEALAGFLSGEGIEIVTDVTAQEVRRVGERVQIRARVRGRAETFEGSRLLVATGREPNTRDLGLEAVGVQLDRGGFVVVDETLESTARGVYAAGDVVGEPMYVYTAAYEGSLAAENALTGLARARDYTALPWVIFTDPQIAGVGLDERQATAQGFAAQATTLPLSAVPRAIAARDTRGFITLTRDRTTDRLLGARILAPEGAELLMEVALAIKYGIPARELATAFHPYLTLGEGVKLAALAFEKDVSRLSCCAS
jgi:mercuric reductase